MSEGRVRSRRSEALPAAGEPPAGPGEDPTASAVTRPADEVADPDPVVVVGVGQVADAVRAGL
ncbi:MAG: hypothetical protein ACTIAP_12710, partial [Cellulosimicrobium funkei]